jgi:hypothetical protein
VDLATGDAAQVLNRVVTPFEWDSWRDTLFYFDQDSRGHTFIGTVNTWNGSLWTSDQTLFVVLGSMCHSTVYGSCWFKTTDLRETSFSLNIFSRDTPAAVSGCARQIRRDANRQILQHVRRGSSARIFASSLRASRVSHARSNTLGKPCSR